MWQKCVARGASCQQRLAQTANVENAIWHKAVLHHRVMQARARCIGVEAGYGAQSALFRPKARVRNDSQSAYKLGLTRHPLIV